MSQIAKSSTGGGGGGIETINGDIGSITGPVVTIFANNATVNSGSTVLFENSGTVSTLNVSDASGNTFIGNGSGSVPQGGVSNTSLGYFNAQFLTNGSGNTIIGYNSLGVATTATGNSSLGYGCLGLLDSGSNNVAIGYQGVLNNLLTGSNNIAIGGGSGEVYASSESNNILIQNEGVVGESNVLRIGTQGTLDGEVDECFIAGIVGVTTSNSEMVTIDSTTGQLGVAAIPQSNTPIFQAYLSANQSNVTGDNTVYAIPFDTTAINTGGAFNTGTGVFTAPTTGTYLFTGTVYGQEGGSFAGMTQASINIVATSATFILYTVNPATMNGNATLVLPFSTTIQMTAGDTASVTFQVGNATKTVLVGGLQGLSGFAGFKIG